MRVVNQASFFPFQLQRDANASSPPSPALVLASLDCEGKNRGMMGHSLSPIDMSDFQSHDAHKQCVSQFAHLDSLAFLNRDNIFPLWLYARWIVHVDVHARFKDPSPRPTVSNP
jgi:hypothetical protein